MHIHYTGWRQESNYVPMNFDGRHHSSDGGGNASLSFDSSSHQHHLSSGPSSLVMMRDPLFAPTPIISTNSTNMMTHYEIHVDNSADRPRSVIKKRASHESDERVVHLNCCY